MADPRTFAKKMRAWADDIPKQQNEIKRQVTREVVLNLVPDTPVRTGQARSGYYTTNETPDLVSIPHGPFTQDGFQSIARAAEAFQGAIPGVPQFITNNLPYIGRLNDGYSTQAPKGFVQIAIDKGRAIIQRQVIRYRGY